MGASMANDGVAVETGAVCSCDGTPVEVKDLGDVHYGHGRKYVASHAACGCRLEFVVTSTRGSEYRDAAREDFLDGMFTKRQARVAHGGVR